MTSAKFSDFLTPSPLSAFGSDQARARAKPERAAGLSIQWCQISPIFSEMAGLIRSGIYTGNDQYVGENVKFIK